MNDRRAQIPPPAANPRALAAAADLARQLYPAPVAAVLAERLESTIRLGYLGPDGMSARLVAHLIAEAAARTDAEQPVPAASEPPGATNTPAPVSQEPPNRPGRIWALLGGAR